MLITLVGVATVAFCLNSSLQLDMADEFAVVALINYAMKRLIVKFKLNKRKYLHHAPAASLQDRVVMMESIDAVTIC